MRGICPNCEKESELKLIRKEEDIEVRKELIKVAELVNENETPPLRIQCRNGSLFSGTGLLIQAASGKAVGFGTFPLNRSGCFAKASFKTV